MRIFNTGSVVFAAGISFNWGHAFASIVQSFKLLGQKLAACLYGDLFDARGVKCYYCNEVPKRFEKWIALAQGKDAYFI